MGTHMGHVFTLANSIIGVSVLAMPFCFKQCGIILSILMLLLSSQISRLACHYLMKSAIIERMKNFEMLAFRTFGPTGKLIVELCIIGFMLGTCVAFFVVIGDLGPNILGPVLGLEHPSALRPSVLIGTAIFVVLPLGLLRNVDSLNGICAASLAFYGVLVLKVFFESSTNLFHPSVWGKVYYWRPSGLLRCIPIFSMALSCQTQLFEIFGSLPTTPLDRANAVVKSAVSLTTFFYISVGFFGYIAYANAFLTGNVMMNFSDGASSDIIKICFLLSVAVSFPLVIFPCRASIYSFLYSKIQHSYDGLGSSHIPETRFQCITLVIVTSSLVIGLMIPNIELVLGLVGSTLGVFICVITPGVIFTTVSFKKNNERLLAQILVGAGLVIMVLGTYANLYATEEALTAPLEVPQKTLKVLPKPKDLPLQPQFPNPKEVERIDDALKKLKEEELQKEKENSKGSVPSKGLEKEEEVKNVSPGAFSDQNPQPVKADEGPKPQPIAPEPPEEPQKKIPINIPESLKHLETPKNVEEADKKKPEMRISLSEGTPELIKKAVSSSGVMEKLARKQADPVQPVPPADVPKSQVIQEDKNVSPSESHLPNRDLPMPEKSEKKPIEKNKQSISLNGQTQEKTKELVLSNASSNVNKQVLEKEADSMDVLKKRDSGPQSEQKPVAVPVKDNLSMSMAQGVPLPLAIQSLEKKPEKPEAKKEDTKVGRDILGKMNEEVEVREKRDLEAFEKEDVKEVAPTQGNISAPVKIVDNAVALIQNDFHEVENKESGGQKNENTQAEVREQNVAVKADEVREQKVAVKADEVIVRDIVVSHKSSESPVNIQETKSERGLDSEILDAHAKEPPGKKYGQEEEECPKTTSPTLKDDKPSDRTTPLIKTPSKLTNEVEVAVLPKEDTLPHLKDPQSLIHEHVGKQKK
ncbi:hypothetical protein GE061_003438 [Apolygus lucorum]|uniref:Amino acid transporter transmembrane domain-containing protein n=1 Tax=Apolygus lucorum TaxID=248454 RepID=A0A6A4JSZ9_APOLU|nr:hypothetical protein GE061_003438 [Apolygus lucorum]